jgi:hypothetical protein
MLYLMEKMENRRKKYNSQLTYRKVHYLHCIGSITNCIWVKNLFFDKYCTVDFMGIKRR